MNREGVVRDRGGPGHFILDGAERQGRGQMLEKAAAGLCSTMFAAPRLVLKTRRSFIRLRTNLCLPGRQQRLSGGHYASDLEQLLIDRFIREGGGTSQRYQRALGKVIVRNMKKHAHCNWYVSPSGTDAQRAAIERLLDGVRLENSIATAG